MLDEDDRLEELVDEIDAPENDERAKRAVASLMCGRAARGLDLDDPEQRRLAVVTAHDALDALGLVGDPDMWIPSPTAAKSRTAPFVHGTEGGVKWHREQHKPLCKPCRRWVEVQMRKRFGALAFIRPPMPPLIGLCGTARRWTGHLAAGEALDPACAMYAAWRTSCLTVPNGTGPLAEHLLDEPLPVHMDASPCTHELDTAGNATQDECTGRAGWRQSCSCTWSLLVATKDGCLQLQQEHRRQIILRLISEAN